jgi:cytochrome oxidase Cu insertion factor (SCO1/SenC/PrrC family)
LLAAGLGALMMMTAALADQGHSHGGGSVGASEPPGPAGFDYDPPKPGSYRLPPLGTAADGVALDETGMERRLHDLMKQGITVLSFIYTRCGDLCPLGTMLMRDLHEATAADPALAAGLRLITMSFDPDYDTPEVMAREAQALRGGQGADPGVDWVFLTARDKRELGGILAAYDQRVLAKADPDSPGGPLAHQLRVYLIDRELRVRNIYSLDFLDPRLVMADIRTLKLEEAGKREFSKIGGSRGG